MYRINLFFYEMSWFYNFTFSLSNYVFFFGYVYYEIIHPDENFIFAFVIFTIRLKKLNIR